MQVQEISGTDQCNLAKVSAFWEERVERAQVVVVAVRVAADDIGLQAEPGRESRVFECVAGVGRERPCADIAAAEFTPLKHAFGIVVPSTSVPVKPGADGMPALVRGPLHELGVWLIDS